MIFFLADRLNEDDMGIDENLDDAQNVAIAIIEAQHANQGLVGSILNGLVSCFQY